MNILPAPLIQLHHAGISENGIDLLSDINLEVNKGQVYAVTGPSGSGKTLLGKLTAGLISPDSGTVVIHVPNLKRVFVSQQHDFRYLASTRSYYQQRFEPQVEDDSPTVLQLLQKTGATAEVINQVTVLLKTDQLLGSKLSGLSNGEGKRVQLAQALFSGPEVIILDNPFIGLDSDSRNIIRALLKQLKKTGTTIFIITGNDEIPDFTDFLIEMNNGNIAFAGPFSDRKEHIIASPDIDEGNFKQLKYSPGTFDVAVKMENVTIKYGDKTILEEINWKIRKGDKWALSGHNGSGKSTLLSLITGDNPQAYGNKIILFDKPKGSGESIWEIKKKIGYVSPELHLYFQRNGSHTESISIVQHGNKPLQYSHPKTTCAEAVASGFYDQVGSSFTLSKFQNSQVKLWMQLLNIAHLEKRPLYKTSLGEQRLVLLARALVKDPALLILDEPCQGLDRQQTLYFKEIIDQICFYQEKTLIYVSHYAEDIPACVDKFLYLENGRVISI